MTPILPPEFIPVDIYITTIHEIMDESMTIFHAIITMIMYSLSGKLWHDDHEATQNIIPRF